jgi:hypothetical protein
LVIENPVRNREEKWIIFGFLQSELATMNIFPNFSDEFMNKGKMTAHSLYDLKSARLSTYIDVQVVHMRARSVVLEQSVGKILMFLQTAFGDRQVYGPGDDICALPPSKRRRLLSGPSVSSAGSDSIASFDYSATAHATFANPTFTPGLPFMFFPQPQLMPQRLQPTMHVLQPFSSVDAMLGARAVPPRTTSPHA